MPPKKNAAAKATAATKAPTPAKKEKEMKEWFERLIYAAIADIDTTWNNAAIDKNMYQNYENLRLSADKQMDTLINLFTISGEVTQHLTNMYVQIVEDIKADGNLAGDTETALANVGGLTEWICNLDAELGENLTDCKEVDRFFFINFTGELQNLSKSNTLPTELFGKYEHGLKVLAMQYAKLLRYIKLPMGSSTFCALLLLNNLDQVTIDTIQADLRVAAAPKKRTKKTASTEGSGTTTPNSGEASAAAEEEDLGADAIDEILGE